jgi:hypothetical protein
MHIQQRDNFKWRAGIEQRKVSAIPSRNSETTIIIIIIIIREDKSGRNRVLLKSDGS